MQRGRSESGSMHLHSSSSRRARRIRRCRPISGGIFEMWTARKGRDKFAFSFLPTSKIHTRFYIEININKAILINYLLKCWRAKWRYGFVDCFLLER